MLQSTQTLMFAEKRSGLYRTIDNGWPRLFARYLTLTLESLFPLL